ncbi:hypothetical protein PHBOTO_005921 [Pseudozyma hubeiensis]|nr:hypothetical protein PHBOTO_005921 [Pseudozyma hubeiensis]
MTDRNGVEKGARTDVLQWRSQGTSVLLGLPICVDKWLDQSSSATIEQVVVHLHGKGECVENCWSDGEISLIVPGFELVITSERDASAAWADMAAARSRVQHPTGSILVVAPQFFNGLDKAKVQASSASGLLVWKANGWGEGAPSVLPKVSGGVSSFEALDAILCHFADRRAYPLLKQIVLSGHSMGAQFVHRYSILGSPPLSPQQRECVSVKFVVMNPASYLYFDSHRSGPPAPGMNVYKYGFQELLTKIPSYPSLQERQDPHFYLARMLRERTIHLIHGEADLGVGDDRPEAMAQGATRLDRARNYHAHLLQMGMRVDQLPPVRRWTVDWAPGVKHDGRAMATSNAAIARLFPDSNF